MLNIKLNKRKSGSSIFGILSFYLLILVTTILGWSLNLISVINSDFSNITGLLIAKIIGIPIFPIGVIMGFFF